MKNQHARRRHRVRGQEKKVGPSSFLLAVGGTKVPKFGNSTTPAYKEFVSRCRIGSRIRRVLEAKVNGGSEARPPAGFLSRAHRGGCA